MKKKMLLTIVLLSLSLSLAACQKEQPQDVEPTPIPQVNIRIEDDMLYDAEDPTNAASSDADMQDTETVQDTDDAEENEKPDDGFSDNVLSSLEKNAPDEDARPGEDNEDDNADPEAKTGDGETADTDI